LSGGRLRGFFGRGNRPDNKVVALRRSVLKGSKFGVSADESRVLAKTWQVPRPVQLKMLLMDTKLHIKEFKLGKIIGSGTFSYVRMVFLKYTEDRKAPPPMALKTMKKKLIVDLGQVAHIQAEKAILQMLSCPFVVQFLGSFQDDRRVFFLMEYVHGGELYGRLRREGRLPPDHSKFYAAEMLLALEYLHFVDIVYRDLKPENVMIDRSGHVKLVDFGFAKVLGGNQSFTIVGTPEYLAPEIIQSRGHGTPADVWALGVIIYEMLAGYPPFFDKSPYDIYRKILNLEITYLRHFDVKAVDLMRQLLMTRPESRLTAIACMDHLWFDYVEWMPLWAQDIPPPWQPRVLTPDDLRLFETIAEGDIAPDAFEQAPVIRKDVNLQFVNF